MNSFLASDLLYCHSASPNLLLTWHWRLHRKGNSSQTPETTDKWRLVEVLRRSFMKKSIFTLIVCHCLVLNDCRIHNTWQHNYLKSILYLTLYFTRWKLFVLPILYMNNHVETIFWSLFRCFCMIFFYKVWFPKNSETDFCYSVTVMNCEMALKTRHPGYSYYAQDMSDNTFTIVRTYTPTHDD